MTQSCRSPCGKFRCGCGRIWCGNCRCGCGNYRCDCYNSRCCCSMIHASFSTAVVKKKKTILFHHHSTWYSVLHQHRQQSNRIKNTFIHSKTSWFPTPSHCYCNKTNHMSILCCWRTLLVCLVFCNVVLFDACLFVLSMYLFIHMSWYISIACFRRQMSHLYLSDSSCGACIFLESPFNCLSYPDVVVSYSFPRIKLTFLFHTLTTYLPWSRVIFGPSSFLVS